MVWRAVIEAGVMCIMPGHISLPDYQGYRNQPVDAPPATLSRKLLIELLREELGYEGLIVSDNASMIGLTVHADADDLIVESIASGIDIDALHKTPKIAIIIITGLTHKDGGSTLLCDPIGIRECRLHLCAILE